MVGRSNFFVFPVPMELSKTITDCLDDNPSDDRFVGGEFYQKLTMKKPWPTVLTIGAIRGRPNGQGGYVQTIEPRSSLFTNTITTVWKDNIVIYPKESKH